MRIIPSLTVAAFALLSSAANAVIVNIDAGPTGYGCNQCFGGPTDPGLAEGNTVSLVNQRPFRPASNHPWPRDVFYSERCHKRPILGLELQYVSESGVGLELCHRIRQWEQYR